MPWRWEWWESWRAKYLPRHEVWSEFVPHFEELRRRLILCLALFFFASLISYFFADRILDFLTQPLERTGHAALYFQKPYEAFLIYVKVAALSGLMISSPVFFSQAWTFAAPGLYEKEKKFLFPIIVISAALFIVGSLFAYYFVIPWGLGFLLSFQTEDLKPLLGISAYFSFLSGMILAFGFLFDMPVVIVGLVKLGIVRASALARSRRAIIVLIFIVAAILTPSPDPFSQILLAVPLVLLFEISLCIASRLDRQG